MLLLTKLLGVSWSSGHLEPPVMEIYGSAHKVTSVLASFFRQEVFVHLLYTVYAADLRCCRMRNLELYAIKNSQKV